MNEMKQKSAQQLASTTKNNIVSKEWEFRKKRKVWAEFKNGFFLGR
jgi:hypothetical protein